MEGLWSPESDTLKPVLANLTKVKAFEDRAMKVQMEVGPMLELEDLQ